MSLGIPPPHEILVDPKTGLMNDVWYRWFRENLNRSEGDWTPTLQFGGASTGIVYATQSGRYTKIGRLVLIEFHIALSNKGSASGNATIATLPFTPAVDIGAFAYFDSLTVGAGQIAQLNTNGTTIQFRSLNQTTGADSGLSDTNFANATDIKSSFAYSV